MPSLLCLLLATAACRSGVDVPAPRLTSDAVPESPEADRQTPGPDASVSYRFVIVGDFGYGTSTGSNEAAVARMVQAWHQQAPIDLIITVGDNNYSSSLTNASYTARVCGDGANTYYGPWVDRPEATPAGRCTATGDGPVTLLGMPAANRFFPTPGNHDWEGQGTTVGTECQFTGLQYGAYADVFPWAMTGATPDEATGENLYYSFDFPNTDATPLVRFYSLNANCDLADKNGCAENSESHGCPLLDSNACATQYDDQSQWLQNQQAVSEASWSIAFFHQSPYSASEHGDQPCPSTRNWFLEPASLRNAKDYGLSAVVAGHTHNYQRFTINRHPDLPFYVNGAGGYKLDACGAVTPQGNIASATCYSDYGGAMLVTVSNEQLQLDYYATNNYSTPVDSCVVTRTAEGVQVLTCNARNPDFVYEQRSPCQNVATCGDIRGTYCAWCGDDGNAYLENKDDTSEPYYADFVLCKDWRVSSRDCPKSDACGPDNAYQSCPTGQSCQESTGKCVKGGSIGASDCLPDFGVCGDSCAYLTQCENIKGTDCGWCGDDGQAWEEDSSTGPAGIQCTNWISDHKNCPSRANCGPQGAGGQCPQGQCCGSSGLCGTGQSYCGAGCQVGYGACGVQKATPF